jgi:hypothetical protein
MINFGVLPRLLFAAALVSLPIGAAAQSETQGAQLAQQKLQIDIANALRQIELLERTQSQRWADEREKLKEDRDRAWLVDREQRSSAWSLFTGYLVTILGGAIAVWGLLWWWIQWQKKELDSTIIQIPALQESVSSLINISKNWPNFKETVEGLETRSILDQLRHQIIVKYIGELGGRLQESDGTKEDAIKCLDAYAQEVINSLHLLSGYGRYVRQATGILFDEKDVSMTTRELLPRLAIIYHELNIDDMAEQIDLVCRKLGIETTKL